MPARRDGLGVAADRVDVPAERGPGEHERQDQQQHDDDRDGVRHAGEDDGGFRARLTLRIAVTAEHDHARSPRSGRSRRAAAGVARFAATAAPASGSAAAPRTAAMTTIARIQPQSDRHAVVGEADDDVVADRHGAALADDPQRDALPGRGRAPGSRRTTGCRTTLTSTPVNRPMTAPTTQRDAGRPSTRPCRCGPSARP